MTEDVALGHIDGIELSQPVNVVPLDSGTQLQQFVRPNGQMGNYFAPTGTTSLESGLTVTNQSLIQFQSDAPVMALKSTARTDYLYPPGQIIPGSGAGGGTQYFIPNSSAFKPFP